VFDYQVSELINQQNRNPSRRTVNTCHATGMNDDLRFQHLQKCVQFYKTIALQQDEMVYAKVEQMGTILKEESITHDKNLRGKQKKNKK